MAVPLRDRPGQQLFVTASAFRRTDQILPLIAALDLYRANFHADAKLVLAGSFVGEVAGIPARAPFLSLVARPAALPAGRWFVG